MGRRGRNEGSIYQRKDGLWAGQYKIQTANGGKYKYIYGRAREDVAKRLTKAMADRDSGFVFDSESLTLSEYLDRWLKVIQGTISVGSWKQYETIARLHIKPALGKLKLDRVSALHVQSLYTDKLDAGLSPRRVIYIHVTLHKALKQAVRWSLIPRNVTEAVDPPKTAKSRRSIRLSRSALVALKDHERTSEWVFSTASGEPIDCTNFIKQSWRSLKREAGLRPNTRFHDLGHTCATLLLTKGVHPK